MIAQFNPKTIRHSIFAALLVAAVASAASVQPRLDAEVGSSSARSRSIALAAATPQAVSQPAPEATSQQTPKPLPKLSTDEEAHRAALLQERQRLNRAKGEAVDAMTVAYIKINYMKAEDLVTLIRSTGISLLSDHGRVAADTRTNTLLVHDTNAMVTAIRELVTTLDVPLDHIQIEARIAIVDDVFLRNMYTNVKSGPSTASPPAQGGAGGWAAASTIAGDYNIDAELSAAQANHHAEVISSPRIIVENRKQAMIEQGIEVPYREANAATVSYKKMTLSVKVTPQITLDNRINLDIGVIRESLGLPTADSGGHSSSDTRRIQTQHQLIDKQTIVLGKIVEVEAIDKGAVAASSSSIDKRQLIVFLTPKIVHTEVASAN